MTLLLELVVELGRITIETFEKVMHGGAFGLTDGLILVLGLVSGMAEATGNTGIVIVSGITGGIANSFGNSFGLIISGLTARQQQLHRRNHDGIETEVTSVREIAASSLFCFLMSMVALVFPILPFFFLPLETAMLSCVVIGVLLIFSMGYFACKLGGEGNPVYVGLGYAVIAIAGTVACHLVGDILRLA